MAKRLTFKAMAKGAKTLDLNICTGGTVSLLAASADGVRKFKLDAYSGGIVNLPQYDVPVVFELASMRVQENLSQIPLLKDHDISRGIGHAEKVVMSEAGGVTGVGVMSVPGHDRDVVVQAADNGKEWQLSVGGTAGEDDIAYFSDGENFTANGRGLQGPALLVSNYLLREITFVEAGADATGAFATLLASFDSHIALDEHMNFEQWLKSLGIDMASLTAEGLAQQRKMFEAQNAADDGDGDKSDAAEKAAADAVEAKAAKAAKDEEDAAAKVIADAAGTTAADAAVAQSLADQAADAVTKAAAHDEQLQELNAQFSNPMIKVNGKEITLLAHARSERWSAEKFELNARRSERPQAMSSRRNQGSGGSGQRQEMLAAMTFAIMSNASANVERDFSGNGSAREYLNASLMAKPESAGRDAALNRSHDFRHHNLVEMTAAAMELDGTDCTAPARSDAWFKAAFSSVAVQDLFTQSTQAILLDSYMQQMATYANFASIVTENDVPNFKTNERKSVSPDTGELEKLEPTGTAGDATLSAGGETYSISRFAKRWGIDDQDMIDESFSVFRTMPQFLGVASARLYGQVIAKLLLDNPNMADGAAWFNTTAGNLITSSALTAAKVKAALTAFGTQQDGQVSLELDPNVLFTPKALRFTAAEVFNGAPLISGNTTAGTSANVLAGTIDNIVHSALLDNGFNDPDDRETAIAGDATSWYLFDTRYPAIEVGHLQGSSRGPTIRTGQYENGRYGIWFDVKRDLGAAPIRRESAQKNTA